MSSGSTEWPAWAATSSMKRSTVSQSGPVVTGPDIASATLMPRSAAPSAARFRSADATIATNPPISASHSPPGVPPANDSTPAATSSQPKTCPLRPAARCARSWSPVRHHTAAWSTRPPSSGAAGSRLNTPRRRLAPPSHRSTAAGTERPNNAYVPIPAARAAPPTARLASGPLTATTNAARAVLGRSIRVIPPSAHSVMSWTGMPARRPVSACAASWTTRLAISSSAPASAPSVYTLEDSPGTYEGRVRLPSPWANNTTSSGTLQCVRKGIPRTCPIRIEPFITITCISMVRPRTRKRRGDDRRMAGSPGGDP